MPKDTRTRFQGIYARHRISCALERRNSCNCKPSYWGKVWDRAAGKPRKTKFLASASAARNARCQPRARRRGSGSSEAILHAGTLIR